MSEAKPTECYYMPRVGEYYAEEPPPRKRQRIGQSWSAAGYSEEWGEVDLPEEDFEYLAHAYMFQKDKNTGFDYFVARHREEGALYVRRIRNRRTDALLGDSDERETLFRVDRWGDILQMVCSDGGGVDLEKFTP